MSHGRLLANTDHYRQINVEEIQVPADIKREQRYLELAFESSDAIVRLAGLNESDESKELQQRIISGELGFEEAVQIVLHRALAPRS